MNRCKQIRPVKVMGGRIVAKLIIGGLGGVFLAIAKWLVVLGAFSGFLGGKISLGMMLTGSILAFVSCVLLGWLNAPLARAMWGALLSLVMSLVVSYTLLIPAFESLVTCSKARFLVLSGAYSTLLIFLVIGILVKITTAKRPYVRQIVGPLMGAVLSLAVAAIGEWGTFTAQQTANRPESLAFFKEVLYAAMAWMNILLCSTDCRPQLPQGYVDQGIYWCISLATIVLAVLLNLVILSVLLLGAHGNLFTMLP